MSSNPFYLRASKKCSTVMPILFGIDLQRDLGVKPLRLAFFTYIDLDRAESFLCKLIGRVDSLSDVGDYWCSVDDCLRRLRFLLEGVIPRLRRGQVRPTGLTVEHPHVAQVVEYPQERVVEIPESLVEKAIARDLNVIEDGLRLYGKQVVLPSGGRIDILAIDKSGSWVVIEVKGGVADDSTLTQLIDYMSSFQSVHENEKVRGIIVAQGFTKRLIRASKFLDHVKLVEIAVDVNVKRRRVFD